MTIHDPWKHIPIAHVDTYGNVTIADELIEAMHSWRVVKATIRAQVRELERMMRR